ncbi:phage tail tape measure protein [Burkholderia cepacia]|uniref:phage tail tape measure protein n=1 Tax=Burkholderia cepacia TaxID=292 RepID=UPI003EE26162
MSSMTLRYIINLTGDLKRRAAENARAVEQASKRQTTALTNTDKAAQKTEKSIEKIGGKTNADKVDADARRMQGSLNNVTTAANRTVSALGTVTAATQRADGALLRLGGRSSIDRMNVYLGGVARRLEDVRRNAERASHYVGRIGQVGTAVVGGAIAGGVAASAINKKPMSYDDLLAEMTNTAYNDRKTVAGRLLGMKKLDTAIQNAKKYGGTQESIGDALNDILSSGVVKREDAFKMLPGLQKAAKASGADIKDISAIAVRAMQNYGLTADEIPTALSKAIVAGQEGGFELKDMSKWLPKLMGTSKGVLGMTGMKGFEDLISFLQASVITTGSKDEAGNAVYNLLAKVNSPDTIKDFAALGVNLPASMVKAIESGHNALPSFIDFGEQLMSRDKRYVELRKKAASATGDDKKAIYNQMADLMGGTVMGKFLQDREARTAFLGYSQNKDYIEKQVRPRVMAETGQETELSYAVRKGRLSGSVEDLSNEVDNARNRVFSDYQGPLKDLLEGTADLAKEFPALTAAATGAADAMGIIAAAGAGGALLSFLMNRGRAGAPGAPGGGGLGGFGAGPVPVYVVNKVPGWTAPTPGGGAAGAAAGGAAAAGAGRGLMSRLGASAPWMITAGLAAYDLLPTLLDSSKTPTEKVNAAGRAAAGVAGGWAGAQAGAALGAFGGPFAPVTVPLGGALGGAVGYLGATWAGDSLSRMNMLPSQRAGLLSNASGDQVQVPQEMQDRLSILRTTPAYMTNPMMQPTAGLDMLKRMQSEPQRVEIGNGLLGINISVHDDRVLTSTQVLQQPSALRLDPGATNPGGTN